MRHALLDPEVKEATHIQTLYGSIDFSNEGRPKESWERRNLRTLRLDHPLKSPWFPDFWFHRIIVNRRIYDPLARVLGEINARWLPEARDAHGLSHFVKCYCFGDGEGPSLFWWGAAYRLSPAVGGEPLSEVIKIFTRHGFTHAGLSDKRRIRDFEFW
jgi:hypothetical protein